MCGILGFFLNRPLNHNDIDKGLKALNTQKHRGPDNTSYWSNDEEGVFIGHNRLSIIDLKERGNQPMIYNQTVISYNGEIYNFKELKNKYLSKQKFNSFSDTEVLLKLWDLKRVNCLDELDGMFAFSIYSKFNLTLSVDAFGEKPLYYIENQEGVFFASEINPLLMICNSPLDKSLYKTREFLLFGYINSPNTIYKDIKKVPPATILEFKKYKNKIFSKSQIYWEKPKRNYNHNTRNFITKNERNKIKELLIESIESRLISDAPIGLFLSSGIDSSLIASIIKLELGKDIKTYTVKFDSRKTHDESILAKKISSFLRIDNEILISQNDLKYTYDNLKMLYSGDFNDNPTIFSYYQMSLVASKNIKVAISGLGGDELFLGYNRYSFFKKYYELIKFLSSFRRLIKFKISLLGLSQTRIGLLYDNFLSVDENDYYLRYKNLNQTHLFDDISSMINDNYFNIDGMNFFEKMFKYDIERTMPCSYIPASDLGGMRAGLEIRTPFLNKKLFEYMATNFNHKDILNMGGKSILKDILLEYLPSHLINRKKQGFVFPIKDLIKSDSSNYIENRIQLRNEILDESSYNK